MFWMIICSILASLMGLATYIYYLRQGQFDDLEMTKYQVFRENDPDS